MTNKDDIRQKLKGSPKLKQRIDYCINIGDTALRFTIVSGWIPHPTGGFGWDVEAW